MNSDFSTLNQLCDRIANLGSDAMAMNFPVRAHVPQKSFALVERQRLPNLLGYRTESTHHVSPIATTFLRRPQLCTYQPQKPTDSSRTLLVPELGPGARFPMNPGDQPAARKNVDVSSKPFRLQGHHDINTGQTGTDQQDVAVLWNIVECCRPCRRNV